MSKTLTNFDIEAMENHELSNAVAEICGWTDIAEIRYTSPSGVFDEWVWEGISPQGKRQDIPDYCNDLNEMHEAEKHLHEFLWDTYAEYLENNCYSADKSKRLIGADARDKAEAFVKTFKNR